MIEIAALIAVGGSIAATVAVGTRYLNSASDYHEMSAAQIQNEPLIRPHYPSGGDWPENRQT
jgi:hypothetical protein